MRFHGDLDRKRPAFVAMQAHPLVDEAHEMLHSVQDGLNLELNS